MPGPPYIYDKSYIWEWISPRLENKRLVNIEERFQLPILKWDSNERRRLMDAKESSQEIPVYTGIFNHYMGLIYEELDYLNTTITTEDIWDRTGAVVTLHNAGDVVRLGASEKLEFYAATNNFYSDNASKLFLNTDNSFDITIGGAGLFTLSKGAHTVVLSSTGFGLDNYLTVSVDTIETTLTNDDTHIPTSGAVWDSISDFPNIEGTMVAGYVTVWYDSNSVTGYNRFLWDNSNTILTIQNPTDDESLQGVVFYMNNVSEYSGSSITLQTPSSSLYIGQNSIYDTVGYEVYTGIETYNSSIIQSSSNLFTFANNTYFVHSNSGLIQFSLNSDSVTTWKNFLPQTTNLLSLGNEDFQFYDLYIDNLASIDSLQLSNTDVTVSEIELILTNSTDKIPTSSAVYTLYQIWDDMNEPNGFVNKEDSTIFFSNVSRTFYISPVSSSFSFYSDSKKYSKDDTESVTITDTEGLWYIYYNGSGVLTATQTFSSNLITLYALVAAIYWDATNNLAIYFGDERHGINMDSATHLNMHLTEGANYVEPGLGLADFTIGNGSLDVHAQFSYESGQILDEDLFSYISGQLLPAQIPIFYLSGSTPVWRKINETNFPLTTTGTGRAAYNLYSAGSWSLSEVSDNDFVLYHYFATNCTLSGFIAIPGQAQYTTSADAISAASTEIYDIYTLGLPFVEFVPIGTVVFQTKNTYANTVKSKIIEIEPGVYWIDWRKVKIAGGGGGGIVTDHGTLIGLNDDDHLQYLLLTGRAGGQSAYGGTSASEDLNLYANTAVTPTGKVYIHGTGKIENLTLTTGSTVHEIENVLTNTSDHLPTSAAVYAALGNIDYWERDGVNGYLFPQTITDKVGIGTNTPTEILTVLGSITINESYSYKIGTTPMISGNMANLRYFFGNSGNGTTSGSWLLSTGYLALSSMTTGTQNVAYGHKALEKNTTGSWNAAFGIQALSKNTIGNWNVALGDNALIKNTEGEYNISIGYDSLGELLTGDHNVGVGYDVLFYNQSGSYNTAIGNNAGFRCTGSSNIFIGYNAGNNVSIAAVSNRLYIDVSGTTTPLIYGEFDNNIIRINGFLQATTNFGLSNYATVYVDTIETTLTDDDTHIPTSGAVYGAISAVTNWTQEQIEDLVGAMVSGNTETGISVTYDDANGKLNFAVSITQYTDELAQDAINSMLIDTNTINFTYTDSIPELKFDVRYQNSSNIDLTDDASGLKAIIDIDSQTSQDLMYFNGTIWTRFAKGSNGYYLTTNGSGSLAWVALPTSDNYQYWTISGDTGSENVVSLTSIQFTGGSGISTLYNSTTNKLTISSTAFWTAYDSNDTNFNIGNGNNILFYGTGIGTEISDNLDGTYTLYINHEDTSLQASVNNSNGNVIQDITLDGYGHVTALGSVDLDLRYSQLGHTHTYDNYQHWTAKYSTTSINIQSTNILEFLAGSGISIGLAAGTPNQLTISSTVVDTNTTYDIKAVTATGGAFLRLTSSIPSTDDVKFAGAGATTVSYTDDNTITITSTDTNTTYTASNGVTLVGTDFQHVDTSSQTSVDNSLGNVIQDITIDTFGHITALGSVDLDLRYSQLGHTHSYDNYQYWVAKYSTTSVNIDSTEILEFLAGAGISISLTAGTPNQLTISSSLADTNTTYNHLAVTTTNGAFIRLVGSDSTTDDIKITQGTGITVAYVNDNEISITNTITNTDTLYDILAVTTTGGAFLRLHSNAGGTDDVKFASNGATIVSYTDDKTITISSTDTNTTYTTSAENSIGGAYFRLTGSDASQDNVLFAHGTGINIVRTDANIITISSTVTNTDTTYDILAVTTLNGAKLRLHGSDSSTDDVTFTGSGATTVAYTDDNTITISSTDTNTTYTGSNGVSLVGTDFQHSDTSSVSALTSDNSGTTVIQDISFTFDTFGHVTGATVGTVTLSIPSVYTDEQAQDAVGSILVDTNTIDFTYDDGLPRITADVRFQNSSNIALSQNASGLKAELSITSQTSQDLLYYNGTSWTRLAKGANSTFLSTNGSGNLEWVVGGGGSIDGSGTAGYLSYWIDSNTLGNSILYTDGTKLGLNTTSPAYTFHFLDNDPQFIVESYSTTSSTSGTFTFKKSNHDTLETLGVLDSGDAIGKLNFFGVYNNGGVPTWTSVSNAGIFVFATENWISSTNRGTRIVFRATPSGSGTQTDCLTITGASGTLRTGLFTSAPDKALEVNSATGDCLRLTYNDSNGSATNYSDFTVSSAGILTVNSSGASTNFAIAGTNKLTLNATELFPSTNGGLSLGAPSFRWDDLYLYNDAKVEFRDANTYINSPITSILNFSATGSMYHYINSKKYISIETTNGITLNADNEDIDFVVNGNVNNTIFKVDGGLEMVGIKQSIPKSVLDVNGSFGANIAMLTTSQTLSESHYTVLVDWNTAVAARCEITLPSADTADRRIYIIKLHGRNSSNLGTKILSGIGDNIILYEGTSYTSLTSDTLGATVMLQSYNSNWHILLYNGFTGA